MANSPPANTALAVKEELFGFKKKKVLSIQNFFKCGKCGALPRPGLNQCKRCKEVRCADCRYWCSKNRETELRACDHEATENSLVQTLFEDMPFPCKHFEYGCRQVFMERDLKSHEKTCDFKSIKCFGKDGDDCEEKVVDWWPIIAQIIYSEEAAALVCEELDPECQHE